jgi:uncharacterized membrane protein YbhN (UPF0104 family)
MTQRFLLLLKYGLGLGLLAWVIAAHWHMTSPAGEEVGLAAVIGRPVQFDRLVLASVFAVAAVLSTFFRWHLLVRAQGLPFTLLSAFRLGFIGYFLNTFMPGTVGGDVVKATFIAREQERRTVAVATVLFDRIVGMTGLYFVAVLGGTILWSTGLLADVIAEEGPRFVFESALGIALGLLISLLTGWILLQGFPARWYEGVLARFTRIPKVGKALAEAWRAVWMYRSRGRYVGLAFLLGIANHVCNVPAFYFAATTILPADEVPTFAKHFLLVPIGTTIQASFPSPGGVGGGEFGYGMLYELLEAPFAHGVLAALLIRAITWTIGFVGYLVYLRMKPRLAPATECAHETD